MADGRKPVDEDIRYDDQEFNPTLEPKKSKAWLNLLKESEDAFEDWNTHCDNIDKQYANLERLANFVRDKEFQMFWANCEVLKPSIYAKAPVPVVAPKFKDRRPVYQAASELLERCCVVAFDLAYINDLMLQVRDDVALIGRGVAWCRYEKPKKKGYYSYEKVCIDFKHRRDFLHSISRCWYEVTWVAAASYMTRDEARERFYPTSKDAYQDAEYKVDKEAVEVGGADNRERAKFWEIWDKQNQRVCWVAEGVEDILDEDDPHLELQGYFPCPKPAYGTCQRGSLVPVPDVMQYKDQLDEVNMLTGRIHALSDALEVKGFYPAGSTELADAVQTAVSMHTAGRVLVPISNWAAFGGSKEVIIWLPIEEIANTITVLVTLRKQVIDDIYQIMGLSDIMRGATDARETLGAQELKTQYGSTRIRDKQYELIRLARDLVCITGEIMTDLFDPVTLIEMSQTQLPTQQMQTAKLRQLQQQITAQQQQAQQLQQTMAQPAVQQSMQQNPQQGQQLQQMAQTAVQNAQSEMRQIQAEPTIEQVLNFLKNNRIKSFVLDIETDSTIMADENGEKERRTEFVGVLGKILPQIAQLIMVDPSTSEFCGELLKFSVSPFRAGRSMDGAIDELVEKIKQKGQGAKGDDPATAQSKAAIQIEQMKNDRQKERDQADIQLKAQELQLKDKHETMKIQSQEKLKLIELQSKKQDDAAKVAQTNQKMMADREKHQADMIKRQADMQFNSQKMGMAQQTAQAKQADMASRADERRAAQQFRQANQQGGFGP